MYFGYADHHDVVDEFVSKLLGPGRILVCSAGNEGAQYVYIEKPADQYEWSPTATLSSPTSTFQIHSEDEFEFDLKMWKYDGETPYVDYTTGTNIIKSAGVRESFDKSADTPYMYWMWKDKTGKEHEMRLYYSYVKGLTSGYDYSFTLDLPADYYEDELAYISITFRSNSSFKLVGYPHKLLFGEKNEYYNPCTIGWPGSHPQAITVGLISHRELVTNIAGEETYAFGKISPDGFLVNWSSCGPTLDGRPKPEVAAPGYNVVSARSKLYSGNTEEWNDNNKLVVARGTYNNEEREVLMLSGTSMAAPVMTGIVALWLQAKPTLTYDEIVATLSRTCKRPQSDQTYNYGYGYGEVDAYAGLLDILGVTTSIPTLSQKLVGVSMQGSTLRIEGITEPTTVNVYTLSGQQVFSTQTADGIVNLPNLPAAVYAVQCGTLGSSLIRM
jgi:subtilisin family serine protease